MLSMLLMALAAVQSPSTATTAPPSGMASVQAQFEQASAALVAGKWADALAGFQAIDARPSLGSKTRSVVQMRKGAALLRLGRRDDAIVALKAGLAGASATDPSLIDDRFQSRQLLGEAAVAMLDYAEARQEFEAAKALAPDPLSQLAVDLSLIRTTMFEDSDTALGYSDDAIRLLSTQPKNAILEGRTRSWRGRLLLNRGDKAGALVELGMALKNFGGLTSKTDLDDVQVRSDLALANLLAGKRDAAREYLAMTGEGRLPNNAILRRPEISDLPPCGPDMAPSDVVVVEIGILEDGSVLYAQPVYASRRGPMALEFARAVYGFAWNPADFKNVPPFYRYGVRLELRCSVAPDRPNVLSLLRSDVDIWLRARHADTLLPAGSVRSSEAERLRAKLAAAEKGGETPALISPLIALAESGASSREEALKLFDRAQRIVAAEHAPPPVVTYFAVVAASPASSSPRNIAAYVRRETELLANPAIAGDARSAATIRLILAQSQRRRDPAGAEVHLNQVVAQRNLPEHDPLRTAALLQLAAIRAEAHDLPTAQRLYEQTGLSDEQCALVDAQPALVKGRASEGDYPIEARAWGMSGWAMTEFDIRGDGTTTNVRTTMAYPPFVFGPALAHVAERMKFTQSYRPKGGLGCGGQTYSQGFHYING